MKGKKTSDTALQKDIKKLLKKGVFEEVFPCAAAGISWGLGNKKNEVIVHSGNAMLYPEKRKLKKNDFFDLASLTKPLATTMAVLCLFKEKKIGLDENISSLLDKRVRGKKSKITVRHLLSHSSGLPAHREYFPLLKGIPFAEKNKCLEELILNEKLEHEPGCKSIYSDLGFMILGRIIEKKTGCSLADYVAEKVFKPLNIENKIFYNPLTGENKKKKNNFAATEDCPWREKVLCGEVHDDNCFSMGGVAGHSGLFGNIAGVTQYAAMILDIWKGEAEHPNIKKRDLANFLTRQQKIPGSTWALGFDTPAEKESSSGRCLSPTSVGHLGFTGTSLWIDPEKHVVIVLLSNRVHPSRKNIKIRQFRPYFHDRIMEKIFPHSK